MEAHDAPSFRPEFPSQPEADSPRPAEARSLPRLRLPAMYSLVRVRLKDQSRYRWTGYIYDISASGMRFDLDRLLTTGTEVDVRALLPGRDSVTVHASGTVVRLHDDDEPLVGPIRMGMVFTGFATEWDRQRLADYLGQRGLKAA